MLATKIRQATFDLGVRKSTAGLELFAKEAIPSGRFVIEYWGDLVTDDEAQRVGGLYLFEIGNGRTILGSTRKNKARYANHSCDPNSEVRTKGNHVYLFSLQKIEAGEPITYDYGEEYFTMLIKPKGCRCTSCKK